MNPPVKIGITGGIGSGKSVVSRLLELMGIPVYISDKETKQLMLADPCIRRELTALLGGEVYLTDNSSSSPQPTVLLNKPLLAAYLFADAGHARRINGIVHPRVKEDFRRWAQRHAGSEVVGIESAILIEAGFKGEVDWTVVVSAPEEVRICRAMRRDAASREEIVQRIRSQMADEEKLRQADFVITNDGNLPLIPQVLRLLEAVGKKQAR